MRAARMPRQARRKPVDATFLAPSPHIPLPPSNGAPASENTPVIGMPVSLLIIIDPQSGLAGSHNANHTARS